ncbi:hypothetical protein PI125_g6055 [Phytophthora idaei]|nr:hypothetical protein PI125_g6055 [Phytophthora idaei]KAG3156376.1 hypothetical protein PI126_g8802 [Phytophthora idaei]
MDKKTDMGATGQVGQTEQDMCTDPASIAKALADLTKRTRELENRMSTISSKRSRS